MKYSIFILTILFSACTTTGEDEISNFTFPPEWTPQEVVWVAWRWDPLYNSTAT
ncbi:MAG: hypothetical protein AAF843_16100 [Bacteroidota bacterium]